MARARVAVGSMLFILGVLTPNVHGAGWAFVLALVVLSLLVALASARGR